MLQEDIKTRLLGGRSSAATVLDNFSAFFRVAAHCSSRLEGYQGRGPFLAQQNLRWAPPLSGGDHGSTAELLSGLSNRWSHTPGSSCGCRLTLAGFQSRRTQTATS